MEEKIKFTIAIPAFKPNYIEEAISSVISQTYTNWELIILDDRSPYALEKKCKKYTLDHRVRYLVNDKNVGAVNLVDNWNHCLSLASGDYFICMGDDDVLDENCLATYNSYIKRFSEYALFHAATEIIDEKSEFFKYQESRPATESVYSMAWHRLSRKREQFIGDFLFKTNVLKEAGGFYKLPLAWGSDDISSYICAMAKGVVNIPEFIFKYRVNRHTISNTGSPTMKLKAIIREKKWYVDNLLSGTPNNEIDRNYQTLIASSIDKAFEHKKLSTMAVGCSCNLIKTMRELLSNRKECGIGLIDILKAIVASTFFKLRK